MLGLTAINLIFLENETAKVAIKTGNTLSKRVDIRNIVMQGSVWGSLMCTASMSKIGDLAYKNKELCYTYKGEVIVPPLGMIDDLLSIQKCTHSSAPNTVINAFVELKN